MNKVADFFFGIRTGGTVPDAVPDCLVPHSFAEAYQAQSILVGQMLAAADQGPAAAIGYKVACTSSIARRLFSADGPVFGRLLSCSSWPDGTTLSAAGFPMLALEPEFAFRMAKDVPETATPWTRGSIKSYISVMLPALELVGHRFDGWSAYSDTTLTADNAVNLGWISGESTNDWRAADLAGQAVTLRVNGKRLLAGSGANVMGHPLNAVAWLANTLPEHGLGLRAGDLVTTGVCTDIYTSAPGECVQADFGELGSVAVSFVE
ncbi:MAG: fumarylacetoacetate hydrolase family protein [Rhodobacteraceae bacterium]|nr:fumarylacetoacetate hydrolase family protein [Paracoccaceae bacterium]